MEALSLDTEIGLLAVDIDGCLVPVEHAAYNLETIAEIAALNLLSRTDDSVPSLTIISGRPHAYVDAIMQLLDIEHPASFENGAGLAFRAPYHATLVPEVERRAGQLESLASRLRARDDVILQPGKVASLSVFWYPVNRNVGELVELVAKLIEEMRLDLHVDPSQDCVNVLVPGVDKRRGLALLADAVGLEPGAVAGIGDSLGDLGWMQACGVSCAPANAHPEVRAGATHTSEEPDAQALLAFYQALIASNRRLRERAGGDR